MQFKNCDRGTVRYIGEYSPQYLVHKEAARNIYDFSPHAKLIICLRNPIERFLSTVYYAASMGRLDISESDNLLERYKNKLPDGLYYKQLGRYFDLFPKEQILILIYEDIEKDRKAFIQSIFNFLNVDPDFIPPSLLKKVNVTAKDMLHIRSLHKITSRIHRLIFNRIDQRAIRVFRALGFASIYRFVRKLNTRNPNKVTPIKKSLDLESREVLLDFYNDDIKRLSEYLGRDLDKDWR